ncbi:MAG: MATE family efflux transporter [Myxococcota bacterium]
MISRSSLSWGQRPVTELARLAWPIGVSMLSYSTMTLVDTLFVSELGTSALGAVGLGGIVYFTTLCFGLGALSACKVLTSHQRGRGDLDYSAILGAGLWLSLGLGVLFVVLNVALGFGLAWIAPADVAAGGQRYLWLRGLGAPIALAGATLREVRYGEGDSQTPMRAALAANLANIGLDWLLIVVWGGAIAGAAIASALAAAIETAWLAVAQREVGFGFDRRGFRAIPKLWRTGWPLGVQLFLQVGSFTALTGIIASMSAIDIAAHQVVVQVIHFGFLPAFAIGEAASVMAGQAMGARRSPLVRVVSRWALGTAGAYGLVCALVLVGFARPLARVFSQDPALTETIVHLFWLAAAFQVFDAGYIVARSILRGIGDIRIPTAISVASAWLCLPTLAYALGYGLGWGAVGAWVGITVDIFLGGSLLWWRLERRHWVVAARRQRRRSLATA